MPDRVLLEEIHLTFTVPTRTPDSVREAARRTLNGRAFRAAIRRAIREVVRKFPQLSVIRLALTS